jgi:maltose-binding protein MalE
MTDTTNRPRRRVTLKRRLLGALALLLLICVSAVLLVPNLTEADPDALAGRVLVWHAYHGPEVDAFGEVLARFQGLHPDVTVHTQAFASRDELLAQFRLSAQSGLGPDLLIGRSSWVRPLADAGAIRSIDDQIPTELREQYVRGAIESLTYHNELYGLPISLEVPALYYNRRLAPTPATTLDELLAQAANGRTVLMSTDFADAFWGVQAFGGRLFDAEGRAILDQGGYANWLDWLRIARDAPGMILDSNREALRERFLSEDAAYYIGGPTELHQILEALGEDDVGVVPLPSGPTGSAGPFLGVGAALFSTVSSPNQRLISVELGKFLTNSEQSATLMRRARLVPANSRVRINPRLHPLVAGFAAQAASAVPIPNSTRMDAVWANANEAYNRVLEGLITPLEAAENTTRAVNEANGFAVTEARPPACTDLGTVRLVHDWEGPAAEALDAIIQRYKQVCPLVIVQSSRENLDLVRSRWAQNPTATTNPDIVLAPQTWLIDAVADGIALRDLANLISNERLQRYHPVALSGMRVHNRLVGVPMTMHVYALFYNRSLVETPAAVLERLRSQADDGAPIALPARFVPAYWGVGAMGGTLMDSQNRVILDQDGLAEWLTWLRRSRDEHGIQIVFEPDESKNLFLAGRSAYHIGGPADIPELLAALGEDQLGVALLPAGPAGDAAPFFEATGFFFNQNSSERRANIAAGFTAFASNAENQALLVEAHSVVPANATVSLDSHPDIAVFVEQTRSAFPIPNLTEFRAVLTLGDQAYVGALQNGVAPEQAAAEVTRRINQANGFAEPTPVDSAATPSPATQSTPDATGEDVAPPATEQTQDQDS